MSTGVLEPIVNPTPGQIAILAELQYFLNRETWLLDHDRLEAWLELFTEDIRYTAPVRKEASRRRGESFGEPGRLMHFDDTYVTLAMRVEKLRTNRSWAEDPPSRVRRLTSNVVLLAHDETSTVVGSNFHIHRETAEGTARSFVGYREDSVVKHASAGWKIRTRTIYLDHTVLPHVLTLLF
jgi:3-phenylpropionate/cinnamic acid dioxygenase small subunit